jgi:hypothetical protein
MDLEGREKKEAKHVAWSNHKHKHVDIILHLVQRRKTKSVLEHYSLMKESIEDDAFISWSIKKIIALEKKSEAHLVVP